MKTSTYNIVAIVLLIAGVCYLNVLSMEKQKETDHQIDITISKIKLFEKKLFPNKILLTGQSGIGKATFAYHFINYILSKNEDYPYNLDDFSINPSNKSYRLI